MKHSDTSERWFEARVVRGLTGVPQPEYSHELAPTPDKHIGPFSITRRPGQLTLTEPLKFGRKDK